MMMVPEENGAAIEIYVYKHFSCQLDIAKKGIGIFAISKKPPSI
jgi:hypothetical protein